MAQTTTPPKPRRAAAKRAPRSGAAQARSTAPKTSARATSSSTRPQTRTARAQQLAERAVLIPVGAALEARDRVADIVTTTRSRGELQRQLKRFERRGDDARTQLEREVRRTRSQLERRTRTARRGFERANVEGFATRVEKVVQNGLDAGMKLVNGAQDRLPKVV